VIDSLLLPPHRQNALVALRQEIKCSNTNIPLPVMVHLSEEGALTLLQDVAGFIAILKDKG